MSRFAKALFALIGSLATWGITAAADGVYDQIEWWTLLGVLATTCSVYFIPNTPPAGDERDPRISETAKPAPVAKVPAKKR